MTDERYGRYFAQELLLDQDMGARGKIQDALNEGETRKWHLVGVSDMPAERVVILFWDTARPSFGRSND